jgi:tetratricopeptide (TPR) repeat protein
MSRRRSSWRAWVGWGLFGWALLVVCVALPVWALAAGDLNKVAGWANILALPVSAMGVALVLVDRARSASGAVEGPQRGSLPTSAGVATPRQLPLEVSGFAGRAAELAELDGLLARRPPAAIVAVSGTGGVGKTALAMRWAHRVARRFPDGQLYVDLRGYDPDESVQPAEALAGFLRALGLAGADIPYELAERAARYRSVLAGRRVLVVLDNASSVGQVRPLLPGTPLCFVLVTSRDSLAGLVARDGARRIDLDLLPFDDSIGLLRDLIGGRVDAEPAAAAALAERCVRLPLALRLAGELATSRPAKALTDLVSELADEQRRLELLDAGADERTAVRAVFSWSYRHLPADGARMFRLCGLHPGQDLDVYAAAALADTDLARATRLFGVLVRGHLVQEVSHGRFGMHDLLRAYATERTRDDDIEQDRRAALTRLFDYYRYTAAVATSTLFPAEGYRRPHVAPPETPIPPVVDGINAKRWLDAERPTLVAAVADAADHGWPTHAGDLAAIIRRYLQACGHYADAFAVHTQACRVAHENGDRLGEAAALYDLGWAHQAWGHHDEAIDLYQQALTIRHEEGDRIGEAVTLNNLGIVYQRCGRYNQAVDLYQQALTIHREVREYPLGEARTLDNLGLTHARLGRYNEAIDCLQRSLTITRETGAPHLEAVALGNLGEVYWRMGRYDDALAHLQQALGMAREAVVLYGDEGDTLYHQGLVYARLGRHDDALTCLWQALAIGQDTGVALLEAQALNGLGETHLAVGRHGDALGHHRRALALAHQLHVRDEQARAHAGIAHALHATGDTPAARRHWQKALTLYNDLGVPEAHEVRQHLDIIDGQDAVHPT